MLLGPADKQPAAKKGEGPISEEGMVLV
jgi:hypothetical protein